jgi:hypothetical protein
MVKLIGVVAKQKLKLGPLLWVTCNIKLEFAVADYDCAAGLRLPAWKWPKRDYPHDERLVEQFDAMTN